MIVYSKFNDNRKSKFQLITKIEKVNNKFIASKTASTAKANLFLNSIYDKYKYLKFNNFSFEPIKPKKTDKVNKITFEFIKSKSIDSLLYKTLVNNDKNKFKKIVESYIYQIKKNSIIHTQLNNEFYKIFYDIDKHFNKEIQSLKTSCIDLNFNNIFFDNKNHKYFLIDYEWTFNFPVPYKYIIFRAITDFYFRYYEYNLNSFVNINSLFVLAEITSKEEKEYINFEYNFQSYVQKYSKFSKLINFIYYWIIFK